MWIPEDADDVTLDCRDCGDSFTTSDPLVIYCEECVTTRLACPSRPDRSEDFMRGEFGGF